MEKAKPQVYLESSVISYHTARPTKSVVAQARQTVTRKWWTEHRENYEILVSQVVLDEISRGDSQAAQKRLALVREYSILGATAEAENLADEYLRTRLVPRMAEDDALHIATASIYRVKYLLSWNFRHIANVHVRESLATFNKRKGLHTPIICTPEELRRD